MTLVNRRIFQELCLTLTALFAVFWAILRASVQSITMDEAQTYLFFVARSDLWYPFSNNHVLNSVLMWITTHAFGNSVVAVRAPALFGAALYILTCYFLCRNITDRFSLRLPLFICLIYNPFIFDFMVAARGYSLADAFLLAAIAIPLWQSVGGRPSVRTSCALTSVALGLSFSANFSFGFVDAAAFLAILTWAIPRRGGQSVVHIVGFCALPGLVIALLICGYPLVHMRRDDLSWGAHSLREMRQSLVQASLYRLDPRFRKSEWYKVMTFLRPLLPPLLIIFGFCRLLATMLDGSWLQDERTRWLGRFAAALAGIATLSVTMSWLAFHLYELPLPLGRTGIYLVPLCTLVAGTIAAAPARSLVSKWLRHGITTVFVCLACYFLLCLRLTYFKEYEWDADLKDAYSVLAGLNHTYGVTDVGASGLYLDSLNYYRVLSKGETFPEFAFVGPNSPVDKSIYVLDGVNDRQFLNRANLAVVYRGGSTDVVITVKPGGTVPPAIIGR